VCIVQESTTLLLLQHCAFHPVSDSAEALGGPASFHYHHSFKHSLPSFISFHSPSASHHSIPYLTTALVIKSTNAYWCSCRKVPLWLSGTRTAAGLVSAAVMHLRTAFRKELRAARGNKQSCSAHGDEALSLAAKHVSELGQGRAAPLFPH